MYIVLVPKRVGDTPSVFIHNMCICLVNIANVMHNFS